MTYYLHSKFFVVYSLYISWKEFGTMAYKLLVLYFYEMKIVD